MEGDPATRVLVSGASGFLGSALSSALAARGVRVVRLSRAAGPGTVQWDPARGRLDPSPLAGVDAVVHLAGATLAGRWTAAKRRAIRDSRIRSTRLLAETLARLEPPPRALISASAVGWYGDRGDTVLDESSAPGRGFLAGVAREWEAAADPARRAGIRVAHPRFAMVLSARGGALPRLLLPFRLGAGGVLGSGRQWWSWIALEDAIAVLLRLLDSPALEGPVNAVAPQAVTQREFTRSLSRVLHRPALLPVPAALLRLLLGRFADEGLLSSARVRPARLVAIGFAFRWPTLEEFLAAEVGRGSAGG